MIFKFIKNIPKNAMNLISLFNIKAIEKDFEEDDFENGIELRLQKLEEEVKKLAEIVYCLQNRN